MTLAPEALIAIAALALASYACRVAGFWLMRFVVITPRVEAGLRAVPIAVMIAIVAPAALRGGIDEWLGLAAVLAAMKLLRNDFLATIVGVATVALLRLWA
jgi:uncharacterized membrane protein